MSAQAISLPLPTASELVAALHDHLARFAHVVAQPSSISVVTAQEYPVRVRLRGGTLAQTCAELLTWFESIEDGKTLVRRSPDGGTLILELRGHTADDVRVIVNGGLQWSLGWFPSLRAGQSTALGSALLSALAADPWEPDTTFPAAVINLSATGGDGR
ncbi:hypothetical protein [Actinokineospora bangkokensis]|uniref:Uncharacterized protein n=1 Tax=Actinokineospora bangkokensis TaxID=1193682 RepID=A0A1Q9LEG0_9PSEU|nr:hypothetical protein [Actinokineospora bangkokensis]OLR90392.1 hypothetical protein BJP25_27460 [Actinokineospora bangkokensis]